MCSHTGQVTCNLFWSQDNDHSNHGYPLVMPIAVSNFILLPQSQLGLVSC